MEKAKVKFYQDCKCIRVIDFEPVWSQSALIDAVANIIVACNYQPKVTFLADKVDISGLFNFMLHCSIDKIDPEYMQCHKMY